MDLTCLPKKNNIYRIIVLNNGNFSISSDKLLYLTLWIEIYATPANNIAGITELQATMIVIPECSYRGSRHFTTIY